MAHDALSMTHLSDQDFLTEVKRLAQRERDATAQLIASLVELDTRKLYLGEGCSSLFTYCTSVLHLSESAAYGRIAAARAARRFPLILGLLAEGALNLTTVGLLAPHITDDNHRAVLEEARYKSKRDVEHQVAALHPRPDVPSSVRKLPAPASTTPREGPPVERAPEALIPAARELPAPTRPAVIAPLAPERYQIKITVSRDTHDKLRRAQDLLRHTIPNGDPASIFDRALTLLLDNLARTRLAATDRPRPPGASDSRSRYVPRHVKRAVWSRDGGHCAFVGAAGRCKETGFLQYHHVVPFAAGGRTTVENLELRCRSHNAFEAAQYFGDHQPWLVREEAPRWWMSRMCQPRLAAGARELAGLSHRRSLEFE